jgi:uncharacterized protein YeaO (DUF488 family)
MPIRTRRWNDPPAGREGLRVLVCRYRPRGVRKEDETWDVWMPDLGPSRELHADFYGKHGPPIGWKEFRKRYLTEMGERGKLLEGLREKPGSRKKMTLLCSSACVDPARCHRTLLAALLERPGA